MFIAPPVAERQGYHKEPLLRGAVIGRPPMSDSTQTIPEARITFGEHLGAIRYFRLFTLIRFSITIPVSTLHAGSNHESIPRANVAL